MNAYRVTGKVAPDRTITVQVPEASVGAEAELIVLFPRAEQDTMKPSATWDDFFEDLKARPRGPSTADEEQAFLRELRNEWD